MNDKMNKHYLVGFTIIELMIAVAIIAVLSAIAIPAYQDQIKRTKRSDGQAFLMEVQAAQERYFTQNVKYGTLAQLGYGTSPKSSEGYYEIKIDPEDVNTTYTLTVTPVSPFKDTECGELTLTNTGVRGSAGTIADCWK